MKKAIIVDIDGTLAEHNDRSPYDTAKCGQDKPKCDVISLVQYISDNPTIEIILFTGRSDEFKEQTIKWLTKHAVPFHQIHMRKAGDFRKDAVVKKEMYQEHVDGMFDVWFVLDDRNQVVDMWRKDLGITCLQVNYGDF